MTEDKRIVWTNIDLDPEDWYDDLREQFPNLDENALYEKMWSLNNEYLDGERANLDLYVGSPILSCRTRQFILVFSRCTN